MPHDLRSEAPVPEMRPAAVFEFEDMKLFKELVVFKPE